MNTQKTTHLVEAPSGTFADRIKVLIQRVGSVTEIARMCGFSEGVVRSWRDGNTDPSRARCVTLAKTLGISLVWLVAGEGTIQTTDSMSSGEDQTSAETLANRHRSKLGTGADTPDMLADLYEILGPGGTDVDATAMVGFNQRLHERVKRGRQAAA